MRTSDAMQRHDFDPIAFTFGVLFTGSGILFMIGRFDLFNRARWLWPGLLVLLGIAVLVGARGRRSQGRGRAVEGAAEPVLDAPDLDTIDPPIGPEAFRLPGWPPKPAGAERPEAEAGSKTDVLEPVEREPVEREPVEREPVEREPMEREVAEREVAERDQLEETAPAPDSRAETEVIDTVDPEAETRPLRQPRPPGEPPASG